MRHQRPLHQERQASERRHGFKRSHPGDGHHVQAAREQHRAAREAPRRIRRHRAVLHLCRQHREQPDRQRVHQVVLRARVPPCQPLQLLTAARARLSSPSTCRRSPGPGVTLRLPAPSCSSPPDRRSTVSRSLQSSQRLAHPVQRGVSPLPRQAPPRPFNPSTCLRTLAYPASPCEMQSCSTWAPPSVREVQRQLAIRGIDLIIHKCGHGSSILLGGDPMGRPMVRELKRDACD